MFTKVNKVTKNTRNNKPGCAGCKNNPQITVPIAYNEYDDTQIIPNHKSFFIPLKLPIVAAKNKIENIPPIIAKVFSLSI